MAGPTHKKCIRCEEWKSIEEFYKQGIRNGKQQYNSRCKPCERAYRRERYADEPKQWKHRNAYTRARRRALSRLSELVPELYEMCLEKELREEGVPYHPRGDKRARRSVTKDIR